MGPQDGDARRQRSQRSCGAGGRTARGSFFAAGCATTGRNRRPWPLWVSRDKSSGPQGARWQVLHRRVTDVNKGQSSMKQTANYCVRTWASPTLIGNGAVARSTSMVPDWPPPAHSITQ